MNGKFEEKLAQLAFGDVTPEEAARIKAQVRQDPEAARLLAEFREMRGGLRDLAEVPEHQLSNERLREAILSQGLRPGKPVEPQKSRGLGAGWVWMPVAACALGFGLMMVKNQPKSEPMVVMKDVPVSTSAGVSLQPPSTSFEPSSLPNMPVASTLGEKKPENAMPSTPIHRTASWEEPEPKPLPRNRRASRFTSDSPTLPTPKWQANEDVEDPSQQVVLNQREANAAKTSATGTDAAATSPAASGPIVLIDSNPDAMTGAPTATEVGNTSNVIVGG